MSFRWQILCAVYRIIYPSYAHTGNQQETSRIFNQMCFPLRILLEWKPLKIITCSLHSASASALPAQLYKYSSDAHFQSRMIYFVFYWTPLILFRVGQEGIGSGRHADRWMIAVISENTACLTLSQSFSAILHLPFFSTILLLNPRTHSNTPQSKKWCTDAWNKLPPVIPLLVSFFQITVASHGFLPSMMIFALTPF